MGLLRIILAFVATLFIMTSGRAELIDNTTIRYKESPHGAVMFEVSAEHAKKVIEPQMHFGSTLDQYKNKAIMIQMTDYVLDHTQYALYNYYGLESDDFEIGKTYIGEPKTLPEGLMFITNVKIKKGLFWKNIKVGFVIPSVKGFKGDEIVYFIYNT